MISPKAETSLYILKRFFLLTLFLVLPQLSAYAFSNPTALGLSEKDLRKGESIISDLRRLEQLTARSIDLEEFATLINKLYPDLFRKVSEIKESDLKTDLTTAVFLYEQAFHESKKASVDIFINCEDESRKLYARICSENESDTAIRFLLSKARLHTRWANSMIKFSRGATDAETLATLAEVGRERQHDVQLGEKALTALKSLEQKVCSYSSLTEFEARGGGGRPANVSFEQLSTDAAAALRSVDRILQSLPRGTLYYLLYNARNSYLDGLFWWQKTQKKLVVDVNSLNKPNELETLQLDPQVMSYTVVINWRNAIKRTRQAEDFIQAARDALRRKSHAPTFLQPEFATAPAAQPHARSINALQ